MAGDRLLPESLACAGPGTVECCKSAVVFATIEALFLSQPSSTSPPTALVSGVGPATLSGNASLGDLPISGCLSSRLWSSIPLFCAAIVTNSGTRKIHPLAIRTTVFFWLSQSSIQNLLGSRQPLQTVFICKGKLCGVWP